ncbi:hypothetical protein KAW18_18625, partial [candidate division WOR-3 bacterium]|nr:hypothetical protein [candidate division WOR-3 bacterium]
MPCCGVIESDIANGAEGCGIRIGRINMDTSGMAGVAEDRLYVQSDGSIDTTIPTSGMVQRVGFLVKKAAGSAGRICVCVRGPRSMYSAKDQHPIIRMGNDAGHKKVVFRNYNNDEIAALDDSGNVTLSGTVDTVDVAVFKSDYDSHEHDDRYYTETEVDTISGSLNTKIEGKSDTTHLHDDRYYLESEVDTISGSLSAEIDSDISTHTSNADVHHAQSHNIASHSDTDSTGVQLNELVGSGDTILHKHDTLYYTESEVDTISGSLNTKIDGKSDTSHLHDDRYYTESEIDTISGSLSSEIDSDISTHTSNADVHHNESHNIASHSDTTASGAQLNTLVGGGNTTLHIHDGRYYTESEIDTISGTLQTDIDGKANTSHNHTSTDITDFNEATDDRVNNLLVGGDNITLTYDDNVNTLTISGSAGNGGVSNHSSLTELDYASAGHTGFQPAGDYATDSELTTLSGNLQTNIDGKSDTSHLHDDRYYTESEIDTISGSLNTAKSDVGHSHTESDISDLDKYTQAEVDGLITTISGKLDDHNEMNNLDYASSGHTGFQPSGDYATDSELTSTSGVLQTDIDGKSNTGHTHDDRYYTETELNNGQLDNRYYTESEVDTISGTLQTNIDGKSDTNHTHDNRYYTESEVDTISGTLQTDIDTRAVSSGAEHDSFSDFIANEHIDHSGVTITAGTGLTGGGNITATR